jgi:hypothetical protein
MALAGALSLISNRKRLDEGSGYRGRNLREGERSQIGKMGRIQDRRDLLGEDHFLFLVVRVENSDPDVAADVQNESAVVGRTSGD